MAFLILTILSSVGFFAATSTAFVVLPIDEFSRVAAMLALSTVLGAVLQFGAMYSLPEAARRDPQERDRLFLRLLGVSVIAGAGITAATKGAEAPDYLVVGVALGGFKGIHIVCDNYLRSHRALLRMSGLNAALHLSYFGVILSLALSGDLTSTKFLVLMIVVKLAFVILAILLIPPSFAKYAPGRPMGFRHGILGSLAVILVFGMGALDVLTLSARQVDGAQFISFRHFAYGLFLTLVVDYTLPQLLSHLIGHGRLRSVHLAIVAAGLGCFVGVMAAILGYGLGALPGKPALSAELAALIFVSMASHTFAVVAFNAAYVTSAIRLDFLIRWLFGLLVIFAASVTIRATFTIPILFAAAGNTLLGVAAMRAYALQVGHQDTQLPTVIKSVSG